MTFQGEEASSDRGGDGVEGRIGILRPLAAGVVAGLGAFFLVRHLLAVGGSTLVEAASELPFFLLSLALLYAGYWLLRYDAPIRRVGRVAACSITGFLGLTAVAIWLVGSQGILGQRTLLLTLDVGTVGASTGLLVGLEGERRDHYAGDDARDAARVAHERFAFLNRLLRHHLLNGVAVIRGHAELLDESMDEPPDEVRVIRRRSDELVGLVQNVETLGQVYTGDLPTGPIDPVEPLDDAVAGVRLDRPTVDIRTDLKDVPAVIANERLDLAFEALLRFAVEHADGGRLSVATGASDGTVTVSIDFDGASPQPSIPPTTVDGGEMADLGLFLAESLIEYFGGTVDVAAEEKGGPRVRLRVAE